MDLRYVNGEYGKTYLELLSRVVHVAAVFVVLLSIPPDERHLILEGIPGLEVCQLRGRRATVLAPATLCHALK